MKTLKSLLLISLILFQPAAQAGLISSLVKGFHRIAADLIDGSKPIARSATSSFVEDGLPNQDRKDDNYNRIPLQPSRFSGDQRYQHLWLKRKQ